MRSMESMAADGRDPRGTCSALRIHVRGTPEPRKKHLHSAIAVVVLASLMLAPACGGTDEAGSNAEIEEPMEPALAGETMEARAEQNALESREEEPVAETQNAASVASGICVGAATLGAGLGCRAAIMACTGTTVVTIGGTAYPCAIVLAVACAAIPASAAVYVKMYCSR